MVGMSIAMVQRYTRFEDKRATGKSVLALVSGAQDWHRERSGNTEL